jgi:hypothetical protein
MDVGQTSGAVAARARVKISERNGWAAGMEGIAMGYHPGWGNLKVGFVDSAGKYTGESTIVPRTMVELVGGSAS